MTRVRVGVIAGSLLMGAATIGGGAHAGEAPVRHLARARPLTITKPPAHGVYTRGNDTVAVGGFGANGYGFPVATPQDRREAQNARIRQNATGLYGYGVDGIGGTGFEDNRETGYSNPYWGNSFNRYVGFNGTPTILAFGPGFANRYAAEHDPEDDDETPGPSPRDLGFDDRDD